MASRNGVLETARIVFRQARGRPGWLSNLIWHGVGYVLMLVTIPLVWFFFHVLNRTTVFGRENVGDEPNTVLLSNHQSMIDSFPVAIEAYYPRAVFKPYLIPWNAAAWENFFKHPLLAFYSSHLRCIPVRPGRRDLKALHRMIEVLPTGTMTLFPEGTRSRSGNVLNGRPGAGLLILATRPRVIPVAIEGMQDILPIGAKTPRIGKRVMVSIGPPLSYSEFLSRPRTRDTAQELVDKAMEAIRAQHAELRRLREQIDRRG